MFKKSISLLTKYFPFGDFGKIYYNTSILWSNLKIELELIGNNLMLLSYDPLYKISSEFDLNQIDKLLEEDIIQFDSINWEKQKSEMIKIIEWETNILDLESFDFSLFKNYSHWDLSIEWYNYKVDLKFIEWLIKLFKDKEISFKLTDKWYLIWIDEFEERILFIFKMRAKIDNEKLF